MNPYISIVTPVYCSEKYIENCINSMISQTLQNIEIILVIDGSPDKCGEIAKSYKRKDNRIVIINQANKGVCSARNVGLSAAKGDYVGFVDPDDWVNPEMFERLYKAAKDSQSEIAACGMYFEYSKWRSVKRPRQIYTGMRIDNPIYNFKLVEDILSGNECNITNKIFDRKFIVSNNIQFKNRFIIGQDLVFILDALSKTKSYTSIPFDLLHYRVHTSSAFNKFRPDFLELCLLIYEYKINFIKNHSLDYSLNLIVNEWLVDGLEEYFFRTVKNQSIFSFTNRRHIFYATVNNDKIQESINVLMNNKFKHKLKYKLIKEKRLCLLILYTYLRIVYRNIFKKSAVSIYAICKRVKLHIGNGKHSIM